MKTIRFPIVFISIFMMMGIVLARFITSSDNTLTFGIFAVFVLLIVLHYILKKSFRYAFFFSISLAVLSFLLGMWLYGRADMRKRKNHYTHFIHNQQKISIGLQIVQVLKPTKYYRRYLTKVSHFNQKKSQGKVLLKIPIGESSQNVGDIINIILGANQLKRIPKPLNPYAFDYQKYLANKQVYHQIVLRNVAYEWISSSTQNWTQYAEISRNKIKKLFMENGLQSEEYDLAVALFLGERRYVSREVKQAFQKSGAIHILAISGLHIGILLIFLRLFFYPVKRLLGKTLFLVLIILFLWFYAFLTGFSSSVLRAVTMFSFLQIGLELKRATNVYNSLFFAALLLLLFNPSMLFEVGFQMSFAAVLSIVSFYPIFSKWIQIKYRVLAWIADLFWISLAAQIGVLPFTLYYFHQFPVYFFITNLLVIPLLFIVLFFGFSMIALGLSGVVLPESFSFFSFLLKSLIQINRKISSLEFAVVHHIKFSTLLFVLIIFGIIVLHLFLKNHRKPQYVFLMFFWILLFQAVVFFEKYKQYKTNEFYVLHQYQTQVFAARRANKMVFYQDSVRISSHILSDFQKALGKIQLHFKQASFFYEFNHKKMLVIDSLGIYKYQNLHPDFVLMSYSPKINFERMLQHLKPEKVIVDGSSYPFLVKRWRKTAKRYQVPFHYTYKQGAFEMTEN